VGDRRRSVARNERGFRRSEVALSSRAKTARPACGGILNRRVGGGDARIGTRLEMLSEATLRRDVQLNAPRSASVVLSYSGVAHAAISKAIIAAAALH